MDRRHMLAVAATGTLGALVTSREASALHKGTDALLADNDEIKVGCACNETGVDVLVYITSWYGFVQALVPNKQCLYFNFIDDKKKRVLSAFDDKNNLISHFLFVPKEGVCFLIEKNTTDPKIDKEKYAGGKGMNKAI